jgi:hypothetical protein
MEFCQAAPQALQEARPTMPQVQVPLPAMVVFSAAETLIQAVMRVQTSRTRQRYLLASSVKVAAHNVTRATTATQAF